MTVKNEDKVTRKNSEGKKEEKVTVKKAFIATPIGPANSDIRRATDGLLSSVIRPILESYDFECVASHEESDQGSISQRMIEHLLDDDLVIVNLTGLNANVMYELGIRHSTGNPVILICEANTQLPFDMYDQRTIFYTNDMQGVMELKKGLESVLSDPEEYSSNKYNPVIAKAKDNLVEKAIENMDFSKIDVRSIAAELYESVQNMASSISYISRRMDRIEYNSDTNRNISAINKYKNKGLLNSALKQSHKISFDSKEDFDLASATLSSQGGLSVL